MFYFMEKYPNMKVVKTKQKSTVLVAASKIPRKYLKYLGEAWNGIAPTHMKKGHSRDAMVYDWKSNFH